MSYRLLLWLACVFAACVAVALPVHGQAPGLPVGTGDVLRITVFQNPDLTIEQRVDEQGRISYPFLGTFAVANHTPAQIERQIAAGLESRDVIKQPQVIVNVAQFRSRQVSVLGNVNRPGRFPLDVPLTVSEALAQAGGIREDGAEWITLSRMENGKHIATEIDVPELFSQAGARRDDVALQAGDVIYVSRSPVFYIYGEVNRPGRYRLERGMTVMQALSTAGGLTLRGTERSVRVTRDADGGKKARAPIELDGPVRADDVIFVRESLF